MEVVIDYEVLKGMGNDPIVKELSLAAKNVFQTFHFQSPYAMHPHGDAENGLNWDEGHINYNQFLAVLTEAVAGYSHLYSYGASKCQVLSDQIGRQFLNLEDFGCPSPSTFEPGLYCGMSCHKFPDIRCAARNAHALYNWLMYHLQKKAYVRCPEDKTRHTAKFVSPV
jgi:hypothetical protein